MKQKYVYFQPVFISVLFQRLAHMKQNAETIIDVSQTHLQYVTESERNVIM